MLFLDGVYVDRPAGATRFRWVKAPTRAELTRLAHTIAHRVGRFLERQSLLERDVENSYLAGDTADDDPMNPLLGSSITYRIAIGPHAGRKVFTLQTLPACEPEEPFGDTVGKVAGFSLHAGYSANATVPVRPRMLLLTGTRQGTGWPPAGDGPERDAGTGGFFAGED